jgi:hypothetical protein
MDCKTARLMLEFARPQHAELDPLDLRALEVHVAACPECTLQAKQERALDEQFGRAMCKVDVPDQLRTRLLRRLAKENAAAAKWRWKRYAAAATAVAALLLLAIGGWAMWHQATLPPLDMNAIKDRTVQNEYGVNPAAIQKEYRERGITMTPPASLNYSFLAFHGMGSLQGQQVPCLTFIRDDSDANIHANAMVYVVSDRDFNLSKVPETYQWAEQGYKYKVELKRESGSPDLYVIVYTGENLNWLRQPDPNGE